MVGGGVQGAGAPSPQVFTARGDGAPAPCRRFRHCDRRSRITFNHARQKRLVGRGKGLVVCRKRLVGCHKRLFGCGKWLVGCGKGLVGCGKGVAGCGAALGVRQSSGAFGWSGATRRAGCPIVSPSARPHHGSASPHKAAGDCRSPRRPATSRRSIARFSPHTQRWIAGIFSKVFRQPTG